MILLLQDDVNVDTILLLLLLLCTARSTINNMSMDLGR